MTRKISLNNTVYTFFGMCVFQLGNFILAILIARMAGVEELGVFQLFVVTSTLFSYFGKLGYDERLVYLLPTLSAGASSLQGRLEIMGAFQLVLKWSLFSSLLFFIFYVALAYFSHAPVGLEAFFGILFIPMFCLSSLLIGVYRAEQEMRLRSLMAYVYPMILTLIVFIVTVLTGAQWLENYNAVFARTTAYTLIFFLVVRMIGRAYKIDFFDQANKIGKGLQNSNSSKYQWLVITVLTFTVESNAIVLWLAKIRLSGIELGTFSVLLRYSGLLLIVPTVLILVFAPRLARSGGASKNIRDMCLFSVVVGVLGISALYFLAGYILPVFGDLYIGQIEALKPMLFGALLLSGGQLCQMFALARRKTGAVMKVNVLLALVSVSIVIGFPMEDLMGAARLVLVIGGLSFFLKSLVMLVR